MLKGAGGGAIAAVGRSGDSRLTEVITAPDDGDRMSDRLALQSDCGPRCRGVWSLERMSRHHAGSRLVPPATGRTTHRRRSGKTSRKNVKDLGWNGSAGGVPLSIL